MSAGLASPPGKRKVRVQVHPGATVLIAKDTLLQLVPSTPAALCFNKCFNTTFFSEIRIFQNFKQWVQHLLGR